MAAVAIEQAASVPFTEGIGLYPGRPRRFRATSQQNRRCLPTPPGTLRSAQPSKRRRPLMRCRKSAIAWSKSIMSAALTR